MSFGVPLKRSLIELAIKRHSIQHIHVYLMTLDVVDLRNIFNYI